MPVLDTLKEKMRALRAQIKANRAAIVDEALELFGVGLDAEEVYEELRDRYLDSVPLIADQADAAVDWAAIIPGGAGQLLEAIDGHLVEALLKLIVQRADRRRTRAARGLTLRDIAQRLRGGAASAVERPDTITLTPEPDEAPSRSGKLSAGGIGLGPI